MFQLIHFLSVSSDTLEKKENIPLENDDREIIHGLVFVCLSCVTKMNRCGWYIISDHFTVAILGRNREPDFLTYGSYLMMTKTLVQHMSSIIKTKI